jgi:hypothetical protein
MAATPPLLDEEHAAFIQGCVSIVAASRDASNAPRLARALGCRVSADRRHVTLLLPTLQAGALIAAIRATGAVAAAFNQPSTHRAIQVKGAAATIGPADPGDARLAARYVDAFVADIALLGYSDALGRALLWHDPAELVAVAFTPGAVFTQTPGPRAGEPLRR